MSAPDLKDRTLLQACDLLGFHGDHRALAMLRGVWVDEGRDFDAELDRIRGEVQRWQDEQGEDRLDREAATAALAEGGPSIPLEALKREMGL